MADNRSSVAEVPNMWPSQVHEDTEWRFRGHRFAGLSQDSVDRRWPVESRLVLNRARIIHMFDSLTWPAVLCLVVYFFSLKAAKPCLARAMPLDNQNQFSRVFRLFGHRRAWDKSAKAYSQTQSKFIYYCTRHSDDSSWLTGGGQSIQKSKNKWILCRGDHNLFFLGILKEDWKCTWHM